MDLRRKVFEDNFRAPGDTPEIVGAIIESELVGIDVPGPQCDARRLDGQPQMLRVPFRQLGFLTSLLLFLLVFCGLGEWPFRP
jgi:hypothetical protein